MQPTSPTIVFFGNERLATGIATTAPTLRALLAAGYHVAAVVSHHHDSRSRRARPLEVAAVAAEHNIPLLLPDKPIEVIKQLSSYNAVAGVLVAYGRIVPTELIDLFPAGIINIHPSLLPLHRGPTPIESVLLDGSSETGVSLMRLAAAMDAGPVYAQAEVALRGDETKQALADQLLGLGAALLTEHLPGILDGSVSAIAQDDTVATYDQLLAKGFGMMDWSQPAAQLEREVRAFAEWPKSHTSFGNLDVVITAAEVVEQQFDNVGSVHVLDKKLIVACGNNSLRILRLKPAGKAEMTAEGFIAGYNDALNAT